MSEEESESKQAFLVPMSAARLLQVVTLGAVVGLTVWALTLFLETYVFRGILCQDDQVERCAQGVQYANAFASVIGAGIGLFFLVRVQAFRPLIVVVAALASLWALVNITQQMPWYGIGLASVGMYALAYMAYVWIARIRLFWLVILIMVAMVVAIRLILNS